MNQNFSQIARDFSFVFCAASKPEGGGQPYYPKIFNCWEEVWLEARKEMHVEEPLYSDPFTRQDFVGSVFHRGTCIGLAFFRWVRGDSETFRNDSYFSHWTPKSLAQLRSRGDNVIVCSHFTLHAAARGKALGLSGKDLLLAMVIELFLNSDADAMTGSVRISRGVSTLCQRWGGEVLEENLDCEYEGEKVDLIGFFKDVITKRTDLPDLKELSSHLWRERVVIGKDDSPLHFLTRAQPLRKVA